jgi:hypothetical protein
MTRHGVMLESEIAKLGLKTSVTRLQEDQESATRESVTTFIDAPLSGQLRRDCQIRNQDMVGIMLGRSGANRSKEEKEAGKTIVVNDIYIDEHEKDETYTVLTGLYPRFLKEVFDDNQEISWFLPSDDIATPSNRASVYEGPFIELLQVMDAAWPYLYEWTLFARDFTWFVDYNHHHSIVIYGNVYASKAKNLVERRSWNASCYSINGYPRGYNT